MFKHNYYVFIGEISKVMKAYWDILYNLDN